mmetsp:Transcript_23443/g.72103  ORF Transcript_23443/g.72103 Transcript_23443/m.72103 type:complete len:454 (-) Transcript_23443:182-1543(-)
MEDGRDLDFGVDAFVVGVLAAVVEIVVHGIGACVVGRMALLQVEFAVVEGADALEAAFLAVVVELAPGLVLYPDEHRLLEEDVLVEERRHRSPRVVAVHPGQHGLDAVVEVFFVAERRRPRKEVLGGRRRRDSRRPEAVGRAERRARAGSTASLGVEVSCRRQVQRAKWSSGGSSFLGPLAREEEERRQKSEDVEGVAEEHDDGSVEEKGRSQRHFRRDEALARESTGDVERRDGARCEIEAKRLQGHRQTGDGDQADDWRHGRVRGGRRQSEDVPVLEVGELRDLDRHLQVLVLRRALVERVQVPPLLDSLGFDEVEVRNDAERRQAEVPRPQHENGRDHHGRSRQRQRRDAEDSGSHVEHIQILSSVAQEFFAGLGERECDRAQRRHRDDHQNGEGRAGREKARLQTRLREGLELGAVQVVQAAAAEAEQRRDCVPRENRRDHLHGHRERP